jgi:hypothetical protein
MPMSGRGRSWAPPRALDRAALAPTALALGIYGAMGHAGAFMQANFFSIMSRQSDGEAWWRLTKEMLTLAPFWLAIFHAPRHLAMTGGSYPRARHVLRAWGVAAFAGFLAFGTWYDHYVGPLLAPCAFWPHPRWGGRSAARSGMRGSCWGWARSAAWSSPPTSSITMARLAMWNTPPA